VVVASRFIDPGTADREDRDPPPVRAAYVDALELTAPDEAERAQEKVVGLKHWCLPWTTGGEVG